MRQTISGKDRQFLTTNQGRQGINRRNSGLDKVPGIFPGHRVNRATIDIGFNQTENVAAVVNRLANTIEEPAL